ncbi:hypothetical protein RFI_22212 [Reticulomyxa filosa]|uniref:Transmembrane protein n=1 Tax=Reticulomyxa filosa TaxID=46433 RepID=X6MMQ6_RETFI|nr:hypothetical protein RFI_22212 [Reticulomyxa filosa]|eukprot:ETO15149.1 hypothetical protein RFI_22212 [Reticulomyxa filosa]
MYMDPTSSLFFKHKQKKCSLFFTDSHKIYVLPLPPFLFLSFESQENSANFCDKRKRTSKHPQKTKKKANKKFSQSTKKLHKVPSIKTLSFEQVPRTKNTTMLTKRGNPYNKKKRGKKGEKKKGCLMLLVETVENLEFFKILLDVGIVMYNFLQNECFHGVGVELEIFEFEFDGLVDFFQQGFANTFKVGVLNGLVDSDAFLDVKGEHFGDQVDGQRIGAWDELFPGHAFVVWEFIQIIASLVIGYFFDLFFRGAANEREYHFKKKKGGEGGERGKKEISTHIFSYII